MRTDNKVDLGLKSIVRLPIAPAFLVELAEAIDAIPECKELLSFNYKVNAFAATVTDRIKMTGNQELGLQLEYQELEAEFYAKRVVAARAIIKLLEERRAAHKCL